MVNNMRGTLEERFWTKVDKNGADGCWIWLASKTHDGYSLIKVKGRMVIGHRVSYELSAGTIPDGMELDHICHNRSCVNPDHLRIATHSENMRNSIKPSNNTSGYKGAYWDKRENKWRACIRVDNALINIGYFQTPEAAHEAYWRAAEQYHGKFANRG